MTLDDRLSAALGGAYRDTFGPAPAALPDPARGHGVALAAGVGAVVVAAGVAIPVVVSNTGSGTTKTPAAGQKPAVLETTPTPVGTPVCGPGDVKLTAHLNKTSYARSVLDQKQAHLGMFAFLAYGELSATTGTPCRSYTEAASIGFVSPSGDFVAFDGTPSCEHATLRHNLTGSAPVRDPLALACATPAPTVSDGMSGTVLAPTEVTDDFGVLMSDEGELSLPGDDVTAVDVDAARRFALQHEGEGTSPEPVFTEFRVDLANDPYIAPAKVEVGTWRLRVTYGTLTAETPFQVTTG